MERRDAFFYLGMGTLFSHELDAMTHHEWRVMPLLRLLPENAGMQTFVLLHVPLFALLVAWVASPRQGVRRAGRLTISAFLVVHAVLHTLFSGHAAYTFDTWMASLLIYGGAVFGAAAFVLDWKGGVPGHGRPV